MKRLLGFAFVLAAACTVQKDIIERTEALRVDVRSIDGTPLPKVDEPPMPLPGAEVELEIDVRARKPDGSLDDQFQGFVRIGVEPGTVVSVSGDRANGRNVLLLNGVAEKQRITVRNARGNTRVWAEDIGYVPAEPNKPPLCADGLDNDDDGKVDYPNDPGCAFANDDTETAGTYATGISSPVRYEKPRLGDVQGRGARTPYQLEGVDVATADPANLIVTRIAADGFYVSDLSDPGGYNHIFAFTFSAPAGMRVCDRITGLTGTAVEFFGFTELSFPSFDLHEWQFPTATEMRDGPCQVPEPIGLDPDTVDDDALIERIESALVRVENVSVGAFFGDQPAPGGNFGPDRSNCDLDGNGDIDFETPGSAEADCANKCGAEPECVEWSAFAARGNYRAIFPNGKSVQLNTGTVPRTRFDPQAMRGKTITALTGTLRNFSGGSLNWTIEARCSSDLVCNEPSQTACVEGPQAPVSSQIACVFPRTKDDPNEGTN
ncbi:MAG: hypothetical protein R3B13_39235 [Polyangiaceae bacterium]